MKSLGVDPSIAATAVALVEGDEIRQKPIDCWRLKSEGTRLADRILSLATQLFAIIAETGPDIFVVEAPSESMAGGYFTNDPKRVKGQLLTLPVYGAATAACMLACMWGRRDQTENLVFTPAANEWTRGLPSVRHDKTRKESRVKAVQYYFGDDVPLGPVSFAGNTADALLLARWGLMRAGQSEYYQEAARRLGQVALSPSTPGPRPTQRKTMEQVAVPFKIETDRVVLYRRVDGNIERADEVRGTWTKELVAKMATEHKTVEAFAHALREHALRPANEG